LRYLRAWQDWATTGEPMPQQELTSAQKLPARLVTDLTLPLAEIGDLPPQFLSAFNGAGDLRHVPAPRFHVIRHTHPRHADDIPRQVVRMLENLDAERNACRAAVLRVANELNCARNGPARFGEILASNAHLAAIHYADHITSSILKAGDPVQW